jgi:hypothetical protein
VAPLPRPAVLALLVFGLLSCKDDPTATVAITVGPELDAFSRSPAPTTLIVENVALDGTVTELSRTALPTDSVSLGDKGRTDVGAFRLSATDGAGKVLLKGESLFVQFGALQEAGLEIFMQRTGETARLPNAPVALDAPRVGLTVARYVLATSGTSSFLYDLLLLKPAPSLGVLPRAAKSLGAFGTAALIIDDAGASTVDLSTGQSSDLAAPTGGTFAEIAGGASTEALDGAVSVVGGTRTTGGPSARVFRIAADGSVAFAALATAREGACAAWVDGRGLFVYGGAGTEAAAELLATGSAIGTKLPFPADAVKGCGATALDGSHVLVVGGVGSPTDVGGAAQARVLDLACTTDCKPTPWMGTLPLVRAEAIALAPDVALVLGDDASGASRLFRATATGPKEITLKVPRRGARMQALPVKNTVAIVGGAPEIEQYTE